MFRTFQPKPAARRSSRGARAGRISGSGIRHPDVRRARRPAWPATRLTAQCSTHHTPVDKSSAPYLCKSDCHAWTRVADFIFFHFSRLTARRPKAVQKGTGFNAPDCRLPNKKTPPQPAFWRDLHHRCANKKIVPNIEKLSSNHSYNAPSLPKTQTNDPYPLQPTCCPTRQLSRLSPRRRSSLSQR